MICPVCKKEIGNVSGFCPKCGQKLEQTNQSSKEINNYWNEVNTADLQRNIQHKKLVSKTMKEKRTQANKTIVTLIGAAVIFVVVVVGGMKYYTYSKKMISDIQSQLVGQTLTARDKHMEGGFNWIYEYWELTFIDESYLDYAYIETVGPRDKEELPEYRGKYNYTVSRSITGSYKIITNGTTYKLDVNGNNEVKGISRD